MYFQVIENYDDGLVSWFFWLFLMWKNINVFATILQYSWCIIVKDCFQIIVMIWNSGYKYNATLDLKRKVQSIDHLSFDVGSRIN